MESEMKELVEESPDMRLVFLSKHCKVALSRFCTWMMSVVNHLDDGDESDLRFLDKQGVVVGLIEKGLAKKDSTGFVKEGINS